MRGFIRNTVVAADFAIRNRGFTAFPDPSNQAARILGLRTTRTVPDYRQIRLVTENYERIRVGQPVRGTDGIPLVPRLGDFTGLFATTVQTGNVSRAASTVVQDLQIRIILPQAVRLRRVLIRETVAAADRIYSMRLEAVSPAIIVALARPVGHNFDTSRVFVIRAEKRFHVRVSYTVRAADRFVVQIWLAVLPVRAASA